MKLQTFSMEVNKSLHDERIKMLSGIDTPPNITELDDIQQIFDNSSNIITQLSTHDVVQEEGEQDVVNDNENDIELTEEYAEQN